MNRTIVVATFKPGTNMQEVFATVRDEVAQVERLRAAQRMGAVHISLARGTVFIEVLAGGEAEVRETIATLPMSKWFDIDLYPVTSPPAGAHGDPAQSA